MDYFLDPSLWLLVVAASGLGTDVKLAHYKLGSKGTEAVILQFPQVGPERWERTTGSCIWEPPCLRRAGAGSQYPMPSRTNLRLRRTLQGAKAVMGVGALRGTCGGRTDDNAFCWTNSDIPKALQTSERESNSNKSKSEWPCEA